MAHTPSAAPTEGGTVPSAAQIQAWEATIMTDQDPQMSQAAREAWESLNKESMKQIRAALVDVGATDHFSYCNLFRVGQNQRVWAKAGVQLNAQAREAIQSSHPNWTVEDVTERGDHYNAEISFPVTALAPSQESLQESFAPEALGEKQALALAIQGLKIERRLFEAGHKNAEGTVEKAAKAVLEAALEKVLSKESSRRPLNLSVTFDSDQICAFAWVIMDSAQAEAFQKQNPNWYLRPSKEGVSEDFTGIRPWSLHMPIHTLN
jgi:hypothetical protein